MESVTEFSSGFLLDTHVLLWWLFDDPKLSSLARAIIRAPENTILVSSASGWEIATKSRLGKIPHTGNVAKDQRSPAERGPGPFQGPSSYPQLCWWSLIYLLQRARMQVLPITMEHALAAGFTTGSSPGSF